ncbi:CHAP domain-containing protein [Sulfitobacter pontiacus]|uniref:CHAP domain-containing protein n=1 Tax=Sulfitobacter pontiacus TaxID=60137 RepID=UPI0007D91898|nr:CHAP domain-containing protein [Sulfitobacter pontiacus]OAN80313.1 CHAP domain-containing protein [Sulfitobacter pontiacus]
MSVKRQWSSKVGIPFLCVALLMTAACARAPSEIQTIGQAGINPDLHAMAIREVRVLQSKGQRVWCVPFARNASGVQIRGNANTWWAQANGLYERGKEPVVGSVMAFKGTSRNPMGHVAVVSEVVSPREIKVDHANWKRNKISLGMSVQDVSPLNDWSDVRLESQAGSYGSVYPINGFIYPDAKSAPSNEMTQPPVFAFSAAPTQSN